MPGNAAASQGRQINLLTTDIAPPHAVYITADDSIELALMCQIAPFLTLTARVLLADGSISANSWNPKLTGGGIINLLSFPLGEGYLLGVTLQGVGQQIRRGQVFAWLSLVRGAASFLNFSQSLAYGYVTTQSAVYWPDMTNESSLSGIGNPRSITGTTPAPGAEINEVVPTGAVWRIKSFFFGFTSSATVATRQILFTLDDGTNIFFQQGATPTITASNAEFYDFAPGMPISQQASRSLQPLPIDTLLFPGCRMRTVTSAIQAGDQYTGIQYLVEEYQQT